MIKKDSLKKLHYTAVIKKMILTLESETSSKIQKQPILPNQKLKKF